MAHLREAARESEASANPIKAEIRTRGAVSRPTAVALARNGKLRVTKTARRESFDAQRTKEARDAIRIRRAWPRPVDRGPHGSVLTNPGDTYKYFEGSMKVVLPIVGIALTGACAEESAGPS
jgi:hypothetical protein